MPSTSCVLVQCFVLCAFRLSPIPWYVEWIYIYYEYIGKYKHARIHFVDGKYIHIIHARRNFCARFVTNAPSHRLSCMRINVYPIHTQSKLMLVVCVFEIMWINPLGSRNVDKAKCLYKNAHQKLSAYSWNSVGYLSMQINAEMTRMPLFRASKLSTEWIRRVIVFAQNSN